MFAKQFGRLVAVGLAVAATGLFSPNVWAEPGRSSVDEMRTGLQQTFEGWSVTENAAKHVSFTITGKDVVFPGVTDNSEKSLQAAAPQVRALLANTIDFGHYGLGSARVDAAGRLGLVTFKQRKDGLLVESGGIRCAFNQQGMLVFVKVDLLEFPDIKPSVRTTQARAEETVLGKYSSTIVEEVTYGNLVYAEGEDGVVYLCHLFSVMTLRPTAAWGVYVDVVGGEIVKTLSISDQVRFNVYGTITHPGGSYSGGQWEFWYCCSQSPEIDCTDEGWGESFADDEGYYFLESPDLGSSCGNAWVKFCVADSVTFAQVDNSGVGDFEEVCQNSEDIVIVGNQQIVRDTVDHDWTETQHYEDHNEELLDYWNVAGTFGGMYEWYSNWLPEISYYERVGVRAAVDCGCGAGGTTEYSTPVIITICNGFENDDPVKCHEMAHAVHYLSGISHYQLNPWPAPFWREAQAEEYAGSYLGIPVPNLTTSREYYNPDKCECWGLNYDTHMWGAIQAGAWSDMVPSLGWAYVDELVWASGLLDASTQGTAMRSLLIADDDDGDLSNGTPNFDVIVAGYEQHYLGPFLPLVFLRDDSLALCWHKEYQIPNESHCWEILDTYCWDSLVWDFGDGSARVNAFAVERAYSECGAFEIICEAYHTFGVNVDTFDVTVSSGDIFLLNSVEGSDDYRFQINLSLTNAFEADTLIVPLRFDGEVDLGFDSVYVAGTRLDGWVVTQLVNEPDSHYVVLQFTGAEPLATGSGVIANLFFTAYTAPLPNDWTLVSVEPCAGYAPHVTHGWEFFCGIKSMSPGKYTLIYYSGDVNGDGVVTMPDYEYLADYFWNNGPEPVYYWSADVDCSSEVDPLDAIYLLHYINGTGPAPCGNLYAGQYDE
ncbi:MAG: dockerin type I repeat-containing protein [Candidatus Zixiibacteriota bacterium]|nr:MAG: dockerin type I repeat-containing protein [candidate division Zixibacteria bacterium]